MKATVNEQNGNMRSGRKSCPYTTLARETYLKYAAGKVLEKQREKVKAILRFTPKYPPPLESYAWKGIIMEELKTVLKPLQVIV